VVADAAACDTRATADVDTAANDSRIPGAEGYFGGMGTRPFVGWLGAGLVLAIGVSVLIQLAVGRVRIAEPTYVANTLATLAGVVVLAGLTLLVVRRGAWTWRSMAAGCALLAALPTLITALPLHGTRWYLGGLAGDLGYHVEYLTRMTDSGHIADVTNPHLPPFYPWPWFWLGGRIAAIAGIPGWAALKPLTITTLAVVPVLSFLVWRLVVTPRLALVLGVATDLAGQVHFATNEEPFAWLSGALIPPLAVLTLRELGLLGTGSLVTRSRSRWRAVVGIGVFTAFVAATYTLNLALYAMTVVVGVLVWTLCSRCRRYGVRHWLTELLALLRRLLPILLVAAVPMLLVWLPYLLKALQAGLPNNPAQRYLPVRFSILPTPMIDMSAQGIVCLLGSIWLVVRFRDHQVAKALATLVIGLYGWWLLSALALAGHTTLLPFRTDSVMEAALFCAVPFAALDVLDWLRRAEVGHWLRPRVSALVGVTGFVLAVMLAQSFGTMYASRIQAAYHEPYPTGGIAAGYSASSHDPATWVAPLRQAISSAAPGRAARSLTLVSDDAPLVATTPYANYVTWNYTYANPLEPQWDQLARLTAWSQAANARAFVSALDAGNGPDVFVLNRSGATDTITVVADDFPHPDGSHYTVSFPDRLFSPADFIRHDVGPYVVLVRRTA
jgi:galactan 5-O-arabinofuranosyltransferase